MPEIKVTAHTTVVKSSDARHAKQRDSTASQTCSMALPHRRCPVRRRATLPEMVE